MEDDPIVPIIERQNNGQQLNANEPQHTRKETYFGKDR